MPELTAWRQAEKEAEEEAAKKFGAEPKYFDWPDFIPPIFLAALLVLPLRLILASTLDGYDLDRVYNYCQYYGILLGILYGFYRMYLYRRWSKFVWRRVREITLERDVQGSSDNQ